MFVTSNCMSKNSRSRCQIAYQFIYLKNKKQTKDQVGIASIISQKQKDTN